jgi:hypothetical protein
MFYRKESKMKYRAIVFKDEQEQEETLVALKMAGIECWTEWSESGDAKVLDCKDRKIDS